jgi:16S rRNA (guanine527-N7)-methyltransferase
VTTDGTEDARRALEGIVGVSHETAEKLALFVGLLRKWQPAQNLIAPGTLSEIWKRHVADSAELVRLFPETRTWVDIGSGAGFPGIVVALAGAPGMHIHLIESNARKCAFLRAVARETTAPVSIHEGRVEEILRGWNKPVDRISARALASLPALLQIAAPLMETGIPGAFHKGKDFRREIAEASQSFAFDLVEHPSRVGEGVILEVTNLRRKPRRA